MKMSPPLFRHIRKYRRCGYYNVIQVLPDVLWVCEYGVCSTDTRQDTKLETQVQVLPLVSYNRAVTTI